MMTLLLSEELRERAGAVVAAAPCSVEMPAGTCKTHLLAAAVAVAAEYGRRSLVLTHTNAGVDAIRRRLRRFEVAPGLVRVETLTSWAYTLARSYVTLAQFQPAEVPDWTRSKDYIEGAVNVTRHQAIQKVLAVSFENLFVDEYQDCSLALHDFVLQLAKAIPQAVVFGDRLQSIFTFDGPMATWDEHILTRFPGHHPPIEPHRWRGHNEKLGAWLLQVRAHLQPGRTFNFAAHDVPGLNFVRAAGPATLMQVTSGIRQADESVLVLDKWARDVADHASRLGGRYLVMEDISGRFMQEVLLAIPTSGEPALARWCAGVAKRCFTGLAGLDAAVLRRLDNAQTVGHYRRPALDGVLVALDELLTQPTYNQAVLAMESIGAVPGVRLYRREAWHDVAESLVLSAINGEAPAANLARVRDRIRRTGRRLERRVASRTLLVKGLEYDHVVIADATKMIDPCDLYVALTRARKTVTIVGATPSVRFSI